MRPISFSMTKSQIRDRSKTVTRRQGWLFLKVGDLLQGVEKAMGLKPGEKHVKLAVVHVVDVRRERVDAITDNDVAREGFPAMKAAEFVELYCKAMRCKPSDECTRIEFEYLAICPACDGQLTNCVRACMAPDQADCRFHARKQFCPCDGCNGIGYVQAVDQMDDESPAAGGAE